jgi:hypothetical protein
MLPAPPDKTGPGSAAAHRQFPVRLPNYKYYIVPGREKIVRPDEFRDQFLLPPPFTFAAKGLIIKFREQ